MSDAGRYQARATLGVPSVRIAAAFRQFAETRGLAVENTPEGLTIRVGPGRVTLAADRANTRLHLSSSDAVNMQLIRDTIAARVSDMGLPITWQDKREPGHPANMSLAVVTAVRQLTPSFVRVVIEGPDLARFSTGGLHFRLLFGPDGADWPTTDEVGVTQWPGGAEAWHRPVYTAREIRTCPDGSAQIDFDVFLHEGGRVTDWTRKVAPGDKIALTGPGGGQGPNRAAHHLLIGDETAVPVIARILAELPDDVQGQAVLFVPDPGDRQELAKPAGLQLDWVMRGTGFSPLGSLKKHTLPPDDRFVFFAGERFDVFSARDHLLSLGLRKSEFHASTYWTAKPG